MIFSSVAFLSIFLPVSFLLYLLMPGMRAKNAFLIVASLAFYAYGEPVYVLILLASAVLNWVLGQVIQGCVGKTARTVSAGVGVAGNLAFLLVFKYAGWIVSLLNEHLGLHIHSIHLELPIGISFYTFEALSYVIDVHRGRVAAQRNFFKMLLYISLFPKMMAGPIIRYAELERQLSHRTVTLSGAATGLRRVSVGLAKKVLIAIPLSTTADSVFSAPHGQINVTVAWIGAVAFLGQIYFDFSGYSDMAIGLARMFGFSYAENFDHPYVSSTVQEFWRRWHMTLNLWFRDYLYIPLGGNRRGRMRASLNRIIVFALCGLWHGANLTFLVWGLFHGFFLVFEDRVPMRRLWRPIGVIYTLLVVCVGFVIFRAADFSQAFFMLREMFTGFRFPQLAVARGRWTLDPVTVTVFIAGAVAATPYPARAVRALRDRWPTLKPIVSYASYLAALVLFVECLLSLSLGGYHPFIYFRF
ncbi:MAG: MBOAT family protein [Actinomycetia bacterium]|nr:MBOAT family protein [Actinomycetes bacterium]